MTVELVAKNSGAIAIIDDTDADLLEFTWTDSGGNWRNGQLGALRRLIGARKFKRQLHSDDMIVHTNRNKYDFTRANLVCMTRAQHSAYINQRIYTRQYPQLTYAITYLKLSDSWRIEADGSIHPDEDTAVRYFTTKIDATVLL